MNKWNLNKALLDFSGKGDYWKIADACEGTQVFGGSGSGKTSGPLKAIATSFLSNEFGGLVLCDKVDEADSWIKLAKETGRSKDVILLSENHFDFLKYESEREGDASGECENIVNVFMEAAEIGATSSNGSGNDPYWQRAGRQLLRNVITLLQLTHKEVTLSNISRIISSSPGTKEEAVNKAWQKSSYCYKLFAQIASKGVSKEQAGDAELTHRYLLQEFPSLDNRTRSNIVSFFTTMADGFMRGKIREIFCSGKVDITPEMTHEQGKILIVDLSVKEWQEIGRYAAGIVKYSVQKSLERRKDSGKDSARPVFIFADESQFFVTNNDQKFQTTARSSRGCTVYATQNYPNYQAVLKNKAIVDALLGNLQTKIFCQNGDKETNNWGAESVCKDIVLRKSKNRSITNPIMGGSNYRHSLGQSEQKDFILEPRKFTELKKGNKDYHYKVSAIIWQGGRKWKNKQPYIETEFKQTKTLFKYSNKTNSIYSTAITIVSYAFLALLLYYIHAKESNYIKYLFEYYVYNEKKSVYFISALLGGTIAYMYLLVSCQKYFWLVIKASFIALLCFSVYYLNRFSMINSTEILIINIYLIGYFTYKLIFKDLFNIKFSNTYIVKR